MKVTLFKKEEHNWWVGSKCTCTVCNSTIELEIGDEDRLTHLDVNQTSNRVSFSCPECNHVLYVWKLHKNNYETSL